jgi:hypothetical protein
MRIRINRPNFQRAVDPNTKISQKSLHRLSWIATLTSPPRCGQSVLGARQSCG